MECAYTGEEIKKTEGKMFVKKSGEVLYFKNAKAMKNYFNNRKHRYGDKQKK
jgi:ribosomal protein L24E